MGDIDENEIEVCNLLGGEVEDDVCRIPLRFYKNERNCKEMFGNTTDEGSCDIPIKFLQRLKKDNKYTNK